MYHIGSFDPSLQTDDDYDVRSHAAHELCKGGKGGKSGGKGGGKQGEGERQRKLSKAKGYCETDDVSPLTDDQGTDDTFEPQDEDDDIPSPSVVPVTGEDPSPPTDSPITVTSPPTDSPITVISPPTDSPTAGTFTTLSPVETTAPPTSPPTMTPLTDAPTPALTDDFPDPIGDDLPIGPRDFDDDTNTSIDFIPDDDTNSSIDLEPDDDGGDDPDDGDGDFSDQEDSPSNEGTNRNGGTGGFIPDFEEVEDDPYVEITNEDFVSPTNGD